MRFWDFVKTDKIFFETRHFMRGGTRNVTNMPIPINVLNALMLVEPKMRSYVLRWIMTEGVLRASVARLKLANKLGVDQQAIFSPVAHQQLAQEGKPLNMSQIEEMWHSANSEPNWIDLPDQRIDSADPKDPVFQYGNPAAANKDGLILSLEWRRALNNLGFKPKESELIMRKIHDVVHNQKQTPVSHEKVEWFQEPNSFQKDIYDLILQYKNPIKQKKDGNLSFSLEWRRGLKSLGFSPKEAKVIMQKVQDVVYNQKQEPVSHEKVDWFIEPNSFRKDIYDLMVKMRKQREPSKLRRLSLREINKGLEKLGLKPLLFGGQDGLLEYIEKGDWVKKDFHTNPLFGKQGFDVSINPKNFDPEKQEGLPYYKTQKRVKDPQNQDKWTEDPSYYVRLGRSPYGGYVPPMEPRSYDVFISQSEHYAQRMLKRIVNKLKDRTKKPNRQEMNFIRQLIDNHLINPNSLKLRKQLLVDMAGLIQKNAGGGFARIEDIGEMSGKEYQPDELYKAAKAVAGNTLDYLLRTPPEKSPDTGEISEHGTSLSMGNSSGFSPAIISFQPSPEEAEPPAPVHLEKYNLEDDADRQRAVTDILSRLFIDGENKIRQSGFIINREKFPPGFGHLEKNNNRRYYIKNAMRSTLGGRITTNALAQAKQEDKQVLRSYHQDGSTVPLQQAYDAVKKKLNTPFIGIPFHLVPHDVPAREVETTLTKLQASNFRIQDPTRIKSPDTASTFELPGTMQIKKAVQRGEDKWSVMEPEEPELRDVIEKPGTKAWLDQARKASEVPPLWRNPRAGIPINTTAGQTGLYTDKGAYGKFIKELEANPGKWGEESPPRGGIPASAFTKANAMVRWVKNKNGIEIPIDDAINTAWEALSNNIGNISFYYGNPSKEKSANVWAKELDTLGLDPNQSQQILKTIYEVVHRKKQKPVPHNESELFIEPNSFRNDIYELMVKMGKKWRNTKVANLIRNREGTFRSSAIGQAGDEEEFKDPNVARSVSPARAPAGAPKRALNTGEDEIYVMPTRKPVNPDPSIGDFTPVATPQSIAAKAPPAAADSDWTDLQYWSSNQLSPDEDDDPFKDAIGWGVKEHTRFISFVDWLREQGGDVVYDPKVKIKDGCGFNFWGAVGHPLGVSISGEVKRKKKNGK